MIPPWNWWLCGKYIMNYMIMYCIAFIIFNKNGGNPVCEVPTKVGYSWGSDVCSFTTTYAESQFLDLNLWPPALGHTGPALPLRQGHPLFTIFKQLERKLPRKELSYFFHLNFSWLNTVLLPVDYYSALQRNPNARPFVCVIYSGKLCGVLPEYFTE